MLKRPKMLYRVQRNVPPVNGLRPLTGSARHITVPAIANPALSPQAVRLHIAHATHASNPMMMRTSGYIVCNQHMERMSVTFPTETAAQEYIDAQGNSHRLYIVELQVPAGPM